MGHIRRQKYKIHDFTNDSLYILDADDMAVKGYNEGIISFENIQSHLEHDHEAYVIWGTGGISKHSSEREADESLEPPTILTPHYKIVKLD